MTLAGGVVRADGNFAVAAGDVEHVGRPGEAGDAAAQRPQQALTFGDGNVKARGAGSRIKLMQVIGLHARGEHGAEQSLQRLGCVVNAA